MKNKVDITSSKNSDVKPEQLIRGFLKAQKGSGTWAELAESLGVKYGALYPVILGQRPPSREVARALIQKWPDVEGVVRAARLSRVM